MFGWIDRIFDWGVTNIGGPVVAWVRDFVRGVFGWLTTFFGHVTESWQILVRAAHNFYNGLIDFGVDVYHAFFHILNVVIPRVIHWAAVKFIQLGNDIIALYHRLVADVLNLIKRIEAAITLIVNWVIVHVWTPLRNDFLTAWHWITHEGALVFYYITHPDKLVDLIWDALIGKLETEAWNIGARLGRFFLALIVHNLRRFVLLLEDILMAVF